eukprot:g3145.t1
MTSLTAEPSVGKVTDTRKSKNATEYTFTMKATKSQGYKGSMQDRFKQFRAKKLAEARMRNYVARRGRGRRSQQQKDNLRAKFLRQVESYIGVPYAQKYHEPGTADYDAPFFLDCCALVRRAVNDLQEDFGFRLGRWNQNYQFSTLSTGSPPGQQERASDVTGDNLPDENGHVVPTNDPSAKKLSDLKPGDLIFWEATYFSEKARKQRLSLVHVEVFTGKGPHGEGTIGARWQKGHVQHFDTFRFESKSYHSIKYHFRSIEDTWLDGICKPAPAHKGFWIDSTSAFRVNKYSMFNASSENEYCDEGAGDVDDDDDGSMAKRRTFYVNQSNGWKLVAAAMADRGWAQIPFDESFSTKFDMRWVERRSQIDWLSHRCTGNDGPQLVNHIANNNVITVKTGLLSTLRDASQDIQSAARFPETYDLSVVSDRLQFLAATQASSMMWIIKPAAMNRGRGIRVVKNADSLRKKLLGSGSSQDDDCGIDEWRGGGSSMDVLVQRYLSSPLLVHGKRKFDIRAYCLVSRCDAENLVAYYHEGYARVALMNYDSSDAKLGDDLVHLTNIAVQRRHPDYDRLKDEAVLSMAKLEDVLDVPKGWVLGAFTDQMKASMAAVVAAAAPKFDRRAGCFDLLGFDFMASRNAKGECVAHLIEVNTNPALHVSEGKALTKILPSLVRGTVDIVLEEHNLEASLPMFKKDTVQFVRIFDEKDGFRFCA